LYTVLYVDDNLADLHLFRIAAGEAGLPYHIVGEADCASAIQFLSTRQADLIVLDWNMPGMHGAEMLRLVRRGLGLKAPVLIFSTSSHEADIRQARELGASGWLQKRQNLDEFIESIALTLPAFLTGSLGHKSPALLHFDPVEDEGEPSPVA